jgi:hypothetical protein
LDYGSTTEDKNILTVSINDFFLVGEGLLTPPGLQPKDLCPEISEVLKLRKSASALPAIISTTRFPGNAKRLPRDGDSLS